MKKTIIALSLCCLFLHFSNAQNVGIGTATPNTSAKLDITSTSSGLLMPRMTTVQRNAILSPATGLMVFDTNTNGYWYYNGATWTQFSSGSATNYWTPISTNIFNNNSGYVGIGTNVPDYKLSIFNNIVESNNNTSVLRLSGRNPVLSITDENNNGFGYLKAWTNGATGGFTNGMVIGAFPGYPIFLSTNYGPAMTVAGNNLVGIGTTTPTSPLSFNNILGNKISFWNAGPNNDFGIGIATGTMQFFTAGTDKIAFGWGNSNAFNETMSYYTGSGQLSIGTTAPAGRLHLASDLEALRITGNQSFISFYNGADYKGYLWNKGTDDMELGTGGVNANGNLYLSIKGDPVLTVRNDKIATIGNTSTFWGQSPLYVYGSLELYNTHAGTGAGDYWQIAPYSDVLYFMKNGGFKAYIDNNGNYNSASDIRLKEDLQSYKSVLDDIKKLNVLTYHFKENKNPKRSFGLIAQNVLEYFPEIVSESFEKNGERFLGLDYSKTGVIAIKAIQEQQVIIEEQQQKINELEKRLEVVEKLISKQ